MDIKKYIAECIGTAVLVILGCGTAMLVGCDAAAGAPLLDTPRRKNALRMPKGDLLRHFCSRSIGPASPA